MSNLCLFIKNHDLTCVQRNYKAPILLLGSWLLLLLLLLLLVYYGKCVENSVVCTHMCYGIHLGNECLGVGILLPTMDSRDQTQVINFV